MSIKTQPISATLALQRRALALYACGDMNRPGLTDQNAEKLLDGDTLALFVWREMKDAAGNRDDAREMIGNAIDELQHLLDNL